MNGILDGRRVHFVGIGGIGMSALARWLLAGGYTVSGCDSEANQQSAALAALGAGISRGHHGEHVRDVDLVVVTSAIQDGNPDVLAARRLGIPVIKRAELLAEIASAGRGIAVAGTHGKTTTSALIGHVLTQADLDPTILIGGVSANLGSNARMGASDLVVVEADEYDASFLHLKPEIAVITNAEADHLDFYGTVDMVHQAYRDFACGVSKRLILCADDPWLSTLTNGTVSSIDTYGITYGDLRAQGIVDTGEHTRFSAVTGDRALPIQMSLAGRHMVRNALAAILVARYLGLGDQDIARGVATFRGVARRLERRGEAAGILVIDDYAHHPTEIVSNLAALRERYHRPIRLIFQPHTYSRTKSFLSEFAASFGGAEAVYLLDIYASRERDMLGISGRDLANEAKRLRGQITYTETGECAVETVLREVQPGDIVLTMGAGDVNRIGDQILDALRTR